MSLVKHHVLVVVSGGVVQSAFSDSREVSLQVIDCDNLENEGIDTDNLVHRVVEADYPVIPIVTFLDDQEAKEILNA